MGTVEVVVAEPEPLTILPATRDPYAIEESLGRLAYTGLGFDGVRAVRRRLRDEAAGGPGAAAAANPGHPEAPVGVAEEAAEEEVRLVRRQVDNLAAWLAGPAANAAKPPIPPIPPVGKDRDRPRALFYVADGWDRDPREFYRPLRKASAAPPAGARAADPLAPSPWRADAPALARTVAGLGWTALPIAVGDAPPPDLRHPLLGRPSAPSPRVGVTLPERDRDRELEKQIAEKNREAPLLLHPLDPLKEIAEASGGEVLESPLALPDVIARLRGRFLLRYEAPPVTDGRARAVAVRAASPDLTLHTRQLAGAGAPAEVAALYARRLLEGEEGRGDLPVSAALRIVDGGPTGRQAQVEVRLAPAALPAGSVSMNATLRLTTAAPEETIGARVAQRLLGAGDAMGATGEEAWTYRVTVPLPEGADRLAVVVDLPASGLWGGRAGRRGDGRRGGRAARGSDALAAAPHRPGGGAPPPARPRAARRPGEGRRPGDRRLCGAPALPARRPRGRHPEGRALGGRGQPRPGAPAAHPGGGGLLRGRGGELGRDSLRLNRPGERPGGAHVRILAAGLGQGGGGGRGRGRGAGARRAADRAGRVLLERGAGGDPLPAALPPPGPRAGGPFRLSCGSPRSWTTARPPRTRCP